MRTLYGDRQCRRHCCRCPAHSAQSLQTQVTSEPRIVQQDIYVHAFGPGARWRPSTLDQVSDVLSRGQHRRHPACPQNTRFKRPPCKFGQHLPRTGTWRSTKQCRSVRSTPTQFLSHESRRMGNYNVVALDLYIAANFRCRPATVHFRRCHQCDEHAVSADLRQEQRERCRPSVCGPGRSKSCHAFRGLRQRHIDPAGSHKVTSGALGRRFSGRLGLRSA